MDLHDFTQRLQTSMKFLQFCIDFFYEKGLLFGWGGVFWCLYRADNGAGAPLEPIYATYNGVPGRFYMPIDAMTIQSRLDCHWLLHTKFFKLKTAFFILLSLMPEHLIVQTYNEMFASPN